MNQNPGAVQHLILLYRLVHEMGIPDNDSLMRLMTKVHDEKGMDFTQYKEPSILRRIQSRLRKYNVNSYDEYIGIIDKNPDEYDQLISALTINVTEFFRNPEAFEAIEHIVIPRIIAAKQKNNHKIIRIWSCGCSTGDEPYSLAMLFLEKLGGAREKFLLTIIGSDIDKEALEEARDMVYPKDRLREVSKHLLDKYFEVVDDNHFQLKSAIKVLVRFRHHDVVKSTPFMHCDLILCRNLLIYFNKELQEETILKFYECLNPGGFLVLGMVESLTGTAGNVFENVDNALRIYRRPQAADLQFDRKGILSQREIDNIVKEMLG